MAIYDREIAVQELQPVHYQQQQVRDDDIHIHLTNNTLSGDVGGSSKLIKLIFALSLGLNVYFYFMADPSCSAGLRAKWQDVYTLISPTAQPQAQETIPVPTAPGTYDIYAGQ